MSCYKHHTLRHLSVKVKLPTRQRNICTAFHSCFLLIIDKNIVLPWQLTWIIALRLSQVHLLPPRIAVHIEQVKTHSLSQLLTYSLTSIVVLQRNNRNLSTARMLWTSAISYRTLRHQDTLGHFVTDLKTLHQKRGTRHFDTSAVIEGHFDPGQFR